MGRTQSPVNHDIWKYMRDHVGEPVFVEDLAKHFEVDRRVIWSAMHTMKRSGEPVERIAQGTYRLNVSTKPAISAAVKPKDGRVSVSDVVRAATQPQAAVAVMEPGVDVDLLFEKIGNTNDGDILIRAHDGSIYRATPL